MTPRQRAAVVEILRCAADHYQICDPCDPSSESDILVAACALGHRRWYSTMACMACDAAYEDDLLAYVTNEDVVLNYLEAAQRVEEGSWP